MRTWLVLALAAIVVASCAPPSSAPPPPPSAPVGAAVPGPSGTAPEANPGGAPGPAAPDDPAADIPACVEKAAGMPFQQFLETVGTSFQPDQLRTGPLARVLPPEAIAAVEGCFNATAASGASPGAPVAPGTSLRELSAQEKAAVQATADRVRSTAVLVGNITRGTFIPGGSGFIYSEDGLVMTNSHVVQELTTGASVMLLDGRVVPAQIVGRVQTLAPDVGVLRIQASGLSVARVGDSDAVRFGDPLLAIAHPRGFGYWLATGGQAYGQKDVSAPGTQGFMAELYSNVPSAAGASGGPLFDAQGQVVGLLFAGSSEPEPGRIAPSPPTILRDPRHWSSIAERPRTTAVAINDAMAAAREIVATGGDLESWSRPFDIPAHRLAGVALQVMSATDIATVPPDLAGAVNALLAGPFPGLRATAGARNAEGYFVTFNEAPSQAAIDTVMLLFGTFILLPVEAAGSVPAHVTEAVPTPAPAAEDARILAALSPSLPSIVHIFARSGGDREQGTGSVLSPDGYILTNAHVIDGQEDTFEVTLHDGRSFPARRVGYVESQTPDVGVLKIEGSGLQPLAIGDPSALQTGAPLFLVGHPAERGFWRISSGSLGRVDRSQGHDQLLASAMSFAGGNSGGPFVNERGEIVGVFHGTLPASGGAIRPSPPEVVWSWHSFDQLSATDDPLARLAAAAAIDVAMARAQAIIQRQGNVP